MTTRVNILFTSPNFCWFWWICFTPISCLSSQCEESASQAFATDMQHWHSQLIFLWKAAVSYYFIIQYQFELKQMDTIYSYVYIFLIFLERYNYNSVRSTSLMMGRVCDMINRCITSPLHLFAAWESAVCCIDGSHELRHIYLATLRYTWL